MYLVSSLWKFGNPVQANEAVKRLRDGFGPRLRDISGFRSWHLALAGSDEAITLALWDSRAAYEAAQEQLTTWGQEQLADLDARVLYRRRGDLVAQERARPNPET